MRKFSIVNHYKIFFSITIIFLIIGIGSMIFRGFNLGIDFTYIHPEVMDCLLYTSDAADE